MFIIRLRDAEDVQDMKFLLAEGPVELTSAAYEYSNGNFKFFNEETYRLVHNAFYGIVGEASDLANAIAGDMASNDKSRNPTGRKPQPISTHSKHTPTNNTQQRPPRPQTATTSKDKELEQVADELDAAMELNPMLKRNLERITKTNGKTFEDAMTRSIVGDYLREYQNIAKAGSEAAMILGRLVETALDDISTQLIEYFVALKAQKVKSISLSQLAKTIQKSPIDIDPYQDMQFFINLIGSLDVIKNVDSESDRVYLELPPQPGDEEFENPSDDKKKPEEKKDSVKDMAVDKAMDNINDKGKGGDADLFKESTVHTANLEVLAFEIAETLSDKLAASGWSGEDDQQLKIGVQSIIKDYPGINPKLVKDATIDMYNQFHAIN